MPDWIAAHAYLTFLYSRWFTYTYWYNTYGTTHCVTCWERADLLALVCGVLLWVCHFPIGILGQVWYLIVSTPDLCTLTYFKGSQVKYFCPWRKQYIPWWNVALCCISSWSSLLAKVPVEARHEISNKVVCATCKASDQAEHTLIRLRIRAVWSEHLL